MSNPGSAPEVGQVSIRVSPDTTKFRRDLYAKLRGIKNKKKTKKKLRYDVYVRPDMKQFRRDLYAGLEKVRNKATVKVKVEADFDKVKMPKTALEVDKQSKRHFIASVDELKAQIAAIPAKVRLEPEVDRSRLRRLVQDMKLDVRRFGTNIMSPLERSILGVSAAFGGLGFVTARGATKAVRGFGAAAAATARGGIVLLNNALEGTAKGISAFAGFVGRLGPQAVALAALIAALLPPTLALLSGTLLLIPAAIGAIVAPIAAVALGAEGMKEALIASGLAMGEWKDGKLELTGIGQNLKNIKKIVSGTFRDNLTAPFAKLNDAIPNLSMQFETLAKGMSSMFSGMVDAMTGPQGLNNIQKFTQNLGVAFEKARPGMQSFTNAFLQLMGKVGERLPGMGDGFTRLGEQFSGWVDKITTVDPSTGVSKLDEALKSLKLSWDQIVGLGGDMLQKGFEWVSDPNFGASMEQFFASVRTFVTDTLPTLGDGFERIADAADAIASAMKPVIGIMNGLGNGFDVIVDSFKGLLTGDGSDLDKTLSDMESRMRNADGTKKGFVDAMLAGMFGSGTGEYGAAAEASGKEYQDKLYDELCKPLGGGKAPVPSDLESAVQSQLQSTIAAAGKPAQEALKDIITADGIAQTVAEQLTKQVTAAVTGAKTAMEGLGPELQGKIDAALAPLETIAEKVGAAFGVIGPAFEGAFGNLVNAAVTGGQQITTAVSSALVNLPQVVRGAFSGLATAAAGAFAPVIGMVVQGSQQILTAVSSNLAQLPAMVIGPFSGMTTAISGQMALAVAAVQEGCATMVSTAQSMAGSMFAAGVSIGNAFAQGIRSMVGVVQAAATDLATAAHRPIPNSPAETGPFSGHGWVTYGGTAVGEAFAKAMAATAPAVEAGATEMVTPASDAIASARKNMEDQSLKLQKSMQDAAEGSIKMGGMSLGIKTGGIGDQLKELQVMQDVIGLREKEIQLQKQMTDDKNVKAGLDAQLKEFQLRRDNLSLQHQQLSEQQKQAAAVDDTFNAMARIPYDFAQATGQQFMDDLGIGGGALTGLAKAGMEYGTNFVFNVSGIGEAMTVQKNEQNKMALAATGSG